jgi:hypothetical protein
MTLQSDSNITGESAEHRVGVSRCGRIYGWNEQRDETAGMGQQGLVQSQRSLAGIGGSWRVYGSIRPESFCEDRWGEKKRKEKGRIEQDERPEGCELPIWNEILAGGEGLHRKILPEACFDALMI